MKDTPPEVNAMIFEAMMRKTPEERLLIGLDMMATARKLAWCGLAESAGSSAEKRERFFQRFYGFPCPFTPLSSADV